MKKRKQRFIATLTAAVIAALCIIPAGAVQQQILLGDANRNGKIEAGDARFALRCAVGLEIYGAIDMLICDVDDNGYIQAEDAREILRVAVGLDSFNGVSYTVDVEEQGGNTDPAFTGYASPTSLTWAQTVANAELIYSLLSQLGWSRNAICAVLGNMHHESGTINPGIQQTYGTAYGLVQWDPPSQYLDWASANGYAADSLIGQVYYLNESMKPGKGNWFSSSRHPEYYETYSVFIASEKDVDYLTCVFLYCYERPGIAHEARRIEHARDWLAYFSG